MHRWGNPPPGSPARVKTSVAERQKDTNVGTGTLGPLLRDSPADDVALDQGSAQAMLVAAAAGFSSRIEAGDDGAVHVNDLSLAVDPQTPIGVVPDRTDRG